LYRAHVMRCWERQETPVRPADFCDWVTLPVKPDVEPNAQADDRPKCLTLREWIGSPSQGERGDFFLHSKRQGEERVRSYEGQFTQYGVYAIIGDLPMNKVTVKQAEAVIARALRCEKCTERALRQGRELSDEEARADRQPFDKQCLEHYPKGLRRRASMEGFHARLAAAWNVAIKAGHVSANPFKDRNFGHWGEPATNDDFRTALKFEQLERLCKAHPDELKVVPVISAYGMLRASEMWGLWRADFPVPAEDDADDPTAVTFELRRVWDSRQQGFRQWGKTTKSLREPVALGAYSTQVLYNHLRNHMPPSDSCVACASGVGIWRGPIGANPHAGCGMADDAPLVAYHICSPEHYSESVAPAAQAAAQLGDIGFAITHISFRSTGATLLIAAGVPESVVMKMGRWANLETLRSHYHRLYGGEHAEAAMALDRLRAAELGEDSGPGVSIDARVRFLERQVTTLTAALDALTGENTDLRVQLRLPDRVPEGIEQVPVRKKRPSKWRKVPDADLREIIETSASGAKALQQVGVTPAVKNYERLRREAERLGVELPATWTSLRNKVPK
jgi:hypothetical protein